VKGLQEHTADYSWKILSQQSLYSLILPFSVESTSAIAAKAIQLPVKE
jgi:hypothetical protein